MEITENTRALYQLKRSARQRMLTDFGPPDKGLNQKQTAWRHLELQKMFRRDIPVKEREDWEAWLEARQLQSCYRGQGYRMFLHCWDCRSFSDVLHSRRWSADGVCGRPSSSMLAN